jgi:putative ABC transport system permease protein
VFRATIKSILSHKLRLLLTALSIVFGVGFVAGTYMLTDTMNAAFDGLFQQINQGTAVEVSGIPQFSGGPPGSSGPGSAQRVPATLVDPIRAVDGVKAAYGTIGGYAQLVDAHGKAVTAGTAPTLGTSWTPDPTLNSLTIKQGRAPNGPNEIAIDAGTAEKNNFKVGQTVKVLLQGPPIQAKIVGIVTFGKTNNLLGATLTAFDLNTAMQVFQGNGAYDAIEVAAQPGVSPATLKSRIQPILPKGFQAQTGAESATQQSDDIKSGLKFLTVTLLVFAGVSLFVGAFVIYNTFSILVAQRTRELALLRALGASTRQVQTAVLGEASAVGLVASIVGIGFGLVIALGLQALLRAVGITLPTTGTVILVRTIVVALVVGLATTLVSAWLPARRVSRVPPIAALRDPAPAPSAPGKRTIIGLAVTLIGVVFLLFGLFGSSSNGLATVGVGVVLIFLGVAGLSALFARPLAGIIGAPFARLSRVSGKLGRENAMRNPRRTASTSAALMIGLGLVGFVAVFAASIKTSTADVLQSTVKADWIVTPSSFAQSGFSPNLAQSMAANSAFGTVSSVRQGFAGQGGSSIQLQAIDPTTIQQTFSIDMLSGSLSGLGSNGLLVDKTTAKAQNWKVGQAVTLQFTKTGKVPFHVAGIYDTNPLLGSYVISIPAYEQNFVTQLDTVVLATTAPGTTPAQSKAAINQITAAFPSVKVQDQAQFRDSQASQVNALLGLVTALLLLAIIIALFGIVNTLALSIFERTREIGLMRAIGMARRQVKGMIRTEAVIIAVFGAVLGIAIGVFFGWAMVQALKDQGISSLSIPGGQLIIYVVLAGLAGVLAAIWPARRAAKLNVLEAITTE